MTWSTWSGDTPGQSRVGTPAALDPCAKGVIVIGVGREVTRMLRDHRGKEKEYMSSRQAGMAKHVR